MAGNCIMGPVEANVALLTSLESEIQAARELLNLMILAARGQKFRLEAILLPKPAERLLIGELRMAGWDVEPSDVRDGNYYIVMPPKSGR